MLAPPVREGDGRELGLSRVRGRARGVRGTVTMVQGRFDGHPWFSFLRRDKTRQQQTRAHPIELEPFINFVLKSFFWKDISVLTPLGVTTVRRAAPRRGAPSKNVVRNRRVVPSHVQVLRHSVQVWAERGRGGWGVRWRRGWDWKQARGRVGRIQERVQSSP